jgi:protein-disulfide isomerase
MVKMVKTLKSGKRPKTVAAKQDSCNEVGSCCTCGKKWKVVLVVLALLLVCNHFYIQKVIETHLFNNPDILVKSLENLKVKQAESDKKAQAAAIKDNRSQLTEDDTAPFLGNAAGTKVMVEFYDYNCAYCRQMYGRLKGLRAEFPELKIVMKEMPVLTSGSVTAAKVALAAELQGKFAEMHTALMTGPAQLDDAAVLKVAATVTGINMNKLKADMNSEAVLGQLQANNELAVTLGLRGIPAIIIGDELLGGAIDEDTIRGKLEK